VLALVSTVFGMMMAVASELPSLENTSEFRAARNSVLLADDRRATPVAKLTGNRNRILVGEADISPNLRNAVVALEDRRFYEHEGVDYWGIGRALWQDLRRQQAVQGGSTITQQFVKNALRAQSERTMFQKLRESALAYHLERKWSKPKILTQYLNSVYFGNGAYGVESAVRTYFGQGPAGHDPNERAARDVEPHEAALLSAIIASPSAYDPVQNPEAARARRDLVLRRMLEQEMITPAEYEHGIDQAVPSAAEVTPPRPDSAQPYFSTWVTQQLVERYGPGRVFGGGLEITTTIDPALQAEAEKAVAGRLAGVGPDAALVAIENKTGEVKALVGGPSFDRHPFNVATNGHRQPGSAFKPFTLVAALQQGYGPGSTFTSKRKILQVRGRDPFVVNNYEKRYSGTTSLAAATEQSDNSVYAELGLQVGTRRIANLARRMGIQTPVSTNPAMTLGGLETGVTPLEMAYAYSTIANKGKRVTGSLATSTGPVAVEKVKEGDEVLDENERSSQRVYSEAIGQTAENMLAGVIQAGTGRAASVGEFAAGKTGTTENYGDAWFVGFNRDWTVAVWVGYPDELKDMKTEYHGGPVAGGTYPAEIWHDFVAGAIRIRDERDPSKKAAPVAPTTPGPEGPAAPSTPSPTGPTYTAPTPAETAPQTTTPTPSPGSGTGGGGTGGGSGTGGGGGGAGGSTGGGSGGGGSGGASSGGASTGGSP
jgi:penicillin-binding protein 1A